MKASPFPKMELPQNILHAMGPIDDKNARRLENAANNLRHFFTRLENEVADEKSILEFKQATTDFIVALNMAVYERIKVIADVDAILSFSPQVTPQTSKIEHIPLEIITIVYEAIEKLGQDIEIENFTNINKDNIPYQFTQAIEILGFKKLNIKQHDIGYSVVPLQNDSSVDYGEIYQKIIFQIKSFIENSKISLSRQESWSTREKIWAAENLLKLIEQKDLAHTAKIIGCIGLITKNKYTYDLTQSSFLKSSFLVMLEEVQELIIQAIPRENFPRAELSSLPYLSLSENLYADEKMAKMVPLLIEGVHKILEILPEPLPLLIIDYAQPTIFNRASIHLRRFKTPSGIRASYPIHIVDVIPQSPGSSDCGYWTLYNSFLVISEMAYSYFHLKNHHYDAFPELKKISHQYLENKNADLTALDLQKLLNEAEKKESKFNSLFPTLGEKLLLLKEALGIPPFTIINSSISNEEQKINSSHVFGGCLPHLKIQLAINFFILSKHQNESIFHLILIGVNQHWSLQLLTFSLSELGSKKSFLFDSGSIDDETLQVLQGVSSHLNDVLKHPVDYAKNVAEEIFPEMRRDLEKFSDKSYVYIIHDHCQLLVQFFSTFGSSMAKQFLPTLEIALKAASGLKDYSFKEKGYQDFESLAANLVKLRNGLESKVAKAKSKVNVITQMATAPSTQNTSSSNSYQLFLPEVKSCSRNKVYEWKKIYVPDVRRLCVAAVYKGMENELKDLNNRDLNNKGPEPLLLFRLLEIHDIKLPALRNKREGWSWGKETNVCCLLILDNKSFSRIIKIDLTTIIETYLKNTSVESAVKNPSYSILDWGWGMTLSQQMRSKASSLLTQIEKLNITDNHTLHLADLDNLSKQVEALKNNKKLVPSKKDAVNFLKMIDDLAQAIQNHQAVHSTSQIKLE